MKHQILALTCMLLIVLSISSYTSYEKVAKIEFIIKNDTRSNVHLYDGKGYFTINRGSAKKVNVETGRKYYNGVGGKKGDFIFEAKSDFEGKTIKLSKYM